MQVSVTFSEVLPKEIEAKEFVSFSLIKDTLFYPINIKGGAISGLAAGVVTTMAALVSLLVF